MKRLIIYFIVLLVIILVAAFLFIFPKSDRKASNEIEWLIENSGKDLTNQHMQNLNETYQITDQHILYLDTLKKRKINSQRYSAIYYLDGKLYDHAFEEIDISRG